MSRHKSFGKSTAAKPRNVLSRFERIDILRKQGRWKDGVNKRATGLPKTKAAS